MIDTTGVQRLLVTGSRDWPSYKEVARVLRACFRPGIVLVTADMRGGCTQAVRVWRKLEGQVQIYPADWEHVGYRAGDLRSEVMCHSLLPGRDLALAFIVNDSPHATYCSNYAREWGIKTLVWHYMVPNLDDWVSPAARTFLAQAP